MRLRSPRLLLLPLSLCLATTFAGCGSDTTTTVTSPTPVTSTETFTGTVQQLGSVSHPIVVTTAGSLSATITSTAPLTTIALGVSISTWDGSACGTAIAQNPNSRPGATALSGTAVAGNYCIVVYDSGNIVEGGSVSYTIQVVHP